MYLYAILQKGKRRARCAMRALPLEREVRKSMYCGALCAPYLQKKTVSQCAAVRYVRFASRKRRPVLKRLECAQCLFEQKETLHIISQKV
jgi:hypothetical protein